jgi:clan AA aspartic protease
MGLVYSQITLSNPVDPNIKSVVSTCIVDASSTLLCIPEHIAMQLGLEYKQYREAVLADGSIQKKPYVGPLQVQFEDRICFVGAMVMGDEVLLGAVPMEDMDLVVLPNFLKLAVNPESPNMPKCLVK